MWDDNLKKSYMISWIIGLIVSGIALFFDFRISTGIILGLISMTLYGANLNASINDLIDPEGPSGSKYGGAFFLRMLFLGLGLFISIYFKQYFSWIATFLAMIFVRAMIYIIGMKIK